MKTYQHPETKEVRTAADDEDVKIAALEKLGYVAITAKDVKDDPKLTVTYEQVTRPNAAPEPPALPKLTKLVVNPPTRDPGAPAPATPEAVTREDVQPFVADKGKDGK